MKRFFLYSIVYLSLLSAAVPLYARGNREPVVPFSPAERKENTGTLYAEGFGIEEKDEWTLLRVTRPWQNAEAEYTYGLYPRGTEPPKADCTLLVEVPVRRIVVLSTTYLSALEELGVTGTLVGIDKGSYVYSAQVLDRMEEGSVVEIGEYPNLDMETLLLLDPDIVMTPVYGAQGAWQELERAGFPVVINGDWLETSALGRAEWIRFIASFFVMDEAASEYMDRTARAYTKLTTLVRDVKTRPTVLLNTPWQGTWYMPGGESYQALLLKDAGAEYLWARTPGTGSLVLDFEEVYSTAGEADFWLHTGSLRSPEEALKDEERFAAFRSFTVGNIYNNDARLRSSGANDYWESGPLVPHRVLEDLIRIFHPGLLEDGELYYYRKFE